MQIGKKTEIKVDGKKLKIAVVLPYFNEELGLELFENVKKELIRNNVSEKNHTIKSCRCIGITLPQRLLSKNQMPSSLSAS
jgi:6,7-dimethyl-8-ribityllumazine synthase